MVDAMHSNTAHSMSARHGVINTSQNTQHMNKYITDGCRPVTAENMSEAAGFFADRIARKHYGKSGYCRTLNLESWSQDNTLGEYCAFIGYSPKGKHNIGTTVGSNIRFSVYKI